MNPTSMIDQLLSGLGSGQGGGQSGQSGRSGFPGGAGGAAAAAGLAGLLLGSKQGRKMMGKGMKYGGMAVLGGLAYRAWQQHQNNQGGGGGGAAPVPPSPTTDEFTPPTDTRFIPAASEQESFGLPILRAMIAAAKADGHIDGAEQARIFEEINQAGLESDDKAFLFDELQAPLDPELIGSLAQSPEMATEMYAASAVVVGDPNRDERRYLDRLAGRLNLDTGLQDAIESEVAALPTA